MSYVVSFPETHLIHTSAIVLQNKAIRAMLILSLASQNKVLFPSNIDSHTKDLYLPQANSTIYQKGVYYAGIRIFNKLPTEIKNASNNFKKFGIVLRHE
jgi:hypothetical protein